MDVKQCECDALALLRRMAGVYAYQLTAGSRADRNFAIIAGEMSSHIESQLKRPEYQGEPGSKTRERLAMAKERLAENSPVMAMEVLRDAIHQNPGVRQLFICGEPHSPANEAPLTQKVYEAIHIMATEDGTPEEAEEAFDKLHSEHTCESGEEEEE